MNVLKHLGSVETLPRFLESKKYIILNNSEVLNHFKNTLVCFKERLDLPRERGYSRDFCWSRISAIVKASVPPVLVDLGMWYRLCGEVVEATTLYMLLCQTLICVPLEMGSYIAVNAVSADTILRASNSAFALPNTTLTCLYELNSSYERSQVSGVSPSVTQTSVSPHTVGSYSSNMVCGSSSTVIEEDIPDSSLVPTIASQVASGKRARHKRKRKKSERKIVNNLLQCKYAKKTRRSKRKKCSGNVRVLDDRKAYDSALQIPARTMLYNLHIDEMWPPSHILSKADNVGLVLDSVLGTSVGVDFESLQRKHLSGLLSFLQLLMARHKRLSHRRLLKHHALTLRTKGRQPFTSSEVYLFTSDVVRRVVPLEFFGSRRNRRTFLAAVRRLIRLGLCHTMTLGMLFRGLRTSSIKWFDCTLGHAMQQHILAKVMLWLLKDYVMILLKSFFYVTESSSGHRAPTFYWKRHWRRLQEAALKHSKFEEVSEAKARSIIAGDSTFGRSFGVGRVRFIPKESGLRHIQTLREVSPSTASVAVKAKFLLCQLNKQRGFSSSTSLQRRLHAIWQELDVASHPNLYLVRTDIKDAYGSIDQNKLVIILLQLKKELLERGSNLSFSVYRAVSLLYMSQKLRVKQHVVFESLPGAFPANSLIVHSENNSVNGEELFSVLLSYVQRQVVQVCHRWYWVTQGLPHGGSLSPALCDLYYGTLEARHLCRLCQHGDRLLRAIDDYLFVTRSEHRAKQFVTCMMEGFPSYNFSTNREKTKANTAIGSIPASRELHICGMEIDAGSMEVRGSYEKMRGCDVAYFLQLHCTGHPGRFLKKSLYLVASLKLSQVFLDETYNSTATVFQTIYKAALLSAFRMHAIVRCVFSRSGPANHWYLTRTIAATASKLARRVSKNSRPPCSGSALSFHVVRWLTFRAFHVKLSQHGGRYKKVVHDVRYLLHRTAKELDGCTVQTLWETTRDGLPDPFHTMV